MSKLEFTKMQGCGNDYVYIVATKARPADPGDPLNQAKNRRVEVKVYPLEATK